MTDNTTPRLLPTSWTAAGNATPQVAELSPLDLTDRIRAVAAARWNGFGLVHEDLQHFLRDHTLADLKHALDDNGIEHLELEFLGDWWKDGSARARSDEMRRDLFTAAERLGARTVKLAPETLNMPTDPSHFQESFDALATEAASHGTRVALETLPFSTNMPRIEDGIQLVSDVANPAGGLCIDIWHVARAGTPYSVISETLSPDHIFVVELNDAATEPVGTLWEDTVNNRLQPGEGSFDVPAFINAIRATGYSGIWGVEIISDAHRALPLETALERTRNSTLAMFTEADRRLGEAPVPPTS